MQNMQLVKSLSALFDLQVADTTQERQAAAASAGGRLSAGTIQLGVTYAPIILGLSPIKHLWPMCKLHA